MHDTLVLSEIARQRVPQVQEGRIYSPGLYLMDANIEEHFMWHSHSTVGQIHGFRSLLCGAVCHTHKPDPAGHVPTVPQGLKRTLDALSQIKNLQTQEIVENQLSNINPPKIFLRHNFHFDPVSGQRNFCHIPRSLHSSARTACLRICKETTRRRCWLSWPVPQPLGLQGDCESPG